MARSKLVGEIGGLIKTQGAALLKMARIGTSREKTREGENLSQWGPGVSKERRGEERISEILAFTLNFISRDTHVYISIH